MNDGRSTQERETNAGPEIIVRRNHDQMLRLCLRQMDQIDDEHRIDQLLLCALQYLLRFDGAAVNGTLVVTDERGEVCNWAVNWIRTVREWRGCTPQAWRQRALTIGMREFDPRIADQ